MRKPLLVPLALVAAIAAYMVWSSSPTVPLTLTRQKVIERAASDATVGGKVAWTHAESKLVTYLGPSRSAGFCEWAVRAFRADGRIATDWGASLCGQGRWPSSFDLLPDRSWFRLD